MHLSEAKNIIGKDAYVHKYINQHPNWLEIVDYIFGKKPLEIKRVHISQVSTIDGETIDRIRTDQYTTQSEFKFGYDSQSIKPDNLFLTYEECLQNLQPKILERQQSFTEAYGGGFNENIVLVS